MRLERLNADKIKIFLTFDDLYERGISKDDLWQDVHKVHQLFQDMMIEADDELGFKAEGPLAVEVFSLPAQGMVVIMSRGEVDGDDEFYDDEFVEMQVTMDESNEIFYEFAGFEDVIALAGRLYRFGILGGTLYSYENRYFIKFDHVLASHDVDYDAFIALIAEYGNPSTMTVHRIQEYGKTLMTSSAIEQLYDVFINR